MQEVDRSPGQNVVRPAPPVESGVETPPERTVEETILLHRGEWILTQVKAFDDDGWPERGLLLAHSPRRSDISRAFRKQPPRPEPGPDAPYQPYYFFRAFPRVRSGSPPEQPAGHAGPHDS